MSVRGVIAAMLVGGALVGGLGCGGVTGSAAPLTARGFAPTRNPVYIRTVTAPSPGLVMLGLVAARGAGSDATVDNVLPELIRQAQRLGATELVIDDLHMDYQWYTSYTTFTYRCGFLWCTDLAPASNEVAILVGQGRAFGPPMGVSAPRPAPPKPPAPAGGAKGP